MGIQFGHLINREAPMNRFCLVGVVLLSAATLLAQAPAGQNPALQRAKAYATAPDIPCTSTADFIKLPTGLYLGEGIGVARNSKNEVFVYTRSGESSRLFKFDASGTFMREIGRGLY